MVRRLRTGAVNLKVVDSVPPLYPAFLLVIKVLNMISICIYARALRISLDESVAIGRLGGQEYFA